MDIQINYRPYFICAFVNVCDAKAENNEISRAKEDAHMISANFFDASTPESQPRTFKFCC